MDRKDREWKGERSKRRVGEGMERKKSQEDGKQEDKKGEQMEDR